MSNYSKQIADLQATRKAKADEMKALAEKAAEQGRTMDTGEQEQFDELKAAVAQIDKNISNLRDLEAIEKAEAADAATAKAVSGDERAKSSVSLSRSSDVQVKDTTKLDKGMGFARYARVKALAFMGEGGTRDEKQIAQNLYPGDERLIQTLVKAPISAANTGDANWAGNLILDGGAYFADFVEFLRERSVVAQISNRLRTLPFDTQVLIQNSGGTAAWVAEGDSKPLTKWSYSRTKLAPLKVATIAAATKEQLRRASVATDALIRDELARAVNAAVDGTFVSDTAAVSGESPAGIRNGATDISSDLAGGTVEGIRCDIATFLKTLAGNNLSVSGSFWVMSEQTAIGLSLATNEVGAAAFPGITPTGGTLAGLPVFTSQYVADETAGPVVMLIKGDEIFLAEGGIDVSTSDQASILMDSTPNSSANGQNSVTPTGSDNLVSLWQTNSVGFLVERWINFAKRRSSAVVWGNVSWDVCAS